MKQQTLTGSVKSGLFYAENPYSKVPQSEKIPDMIFRHTHETMFAQSNPALPIFTTDNQPVQDAEKVEAVGPVWRYYHPIIGKFLKELQCIKSDYKTFEEYSLAMKDGEIKTDQCYLLINRQQWHGNAIEEISEVQDGAARADITVNETIEFLITPINNNKIMKTGIELIAQERAEQIEKHGWDLSHDKDYGNGELLSAARFCLDIADEDLWPWHDGGLGSHFFNKLLAKTHEQRVVIAGAFIAAELDRINSINHER